jgi:hypothetical protein
VLSLLLPPLPSPTHLNDYVWSEIHITIKSPSQHKLCLWPKHPRHNVHSLELPVNHLPLYLEYPVLEYSSNAATDGQPISEDMVRYLGLQDENQGDVFHNFCP